MFCTLASLIFKSVNLSTGDIADDRNFKKLLKIRMPFQHTLFNVSNIVLRKSSTVNHVVLLDNVSNQSPIAKSVP